MSSLLFDIAVLCSATYHTSTLIKELSSLSLHTSLFVGLRFKNCHHQSRTIFTLTTKIPSSPASLTLATRHPNLSIRYSSLCGRDRTMSAGGKTFQLKLIIAVITATFATQENRHAWALLASLVFVIQGVWFELDHVLISPSSCLLLWITIATGLFLYRQAFLLRYRAALTENDPVKLLTRLTQEGNPQHNRGRRADFGLGCHSLQWKLRPRARLPLPPHLHRIRSGCFRRVLQR